METICWVEEYKETVRQYWLAWQTVGFSTRGAKLAGVLHGRWKRGDFGKDLGEDGEILLQLWSSSFWVVTEAMGTDVEGRSGALKLSVSSSGC